MLVDRIRKMISFELSEEIEKDFFSSCQKGGINENSESARGNEPQSFGLHAPMLYHRATETPQ